MCKSLLAPSLRKLIHIFTTLPNEVQVGANIHHKLSNVLLDTYILLLLSQVSATTFGLFLRRGWDKALSEGDALGQAHKRIALLRFACL
jgi:hypothetical protein